MENGILYKEPTHLFDYYNYDVSNLQEVKNLDLTIGFHQLLHSQHFAVRVKIYQIGLERSMVIYLVVIVVLADIFAGLRDILPFFWEFDSKKLYWWGISGKIRLS